MAAMQLRTQFEIKRGLPPILLIISMVQNGAVGMFTDVTDKLIPTGTPVQRNYGVAVSNIGEGEGPMEWIIAGYSGPNIVLQMDTKNGVYRNVARNGTKYESLMDPDGNAIGVCACDIDGDGKEEIYFLNTNNRYSGRKLVTDRLFTWRNNRYENLFEDEVNKNVLSMFSGRSVACIDRTGNGKYGILLATYAEMGNGKFELIEVDETKTRGKHIVLHSIAENVGINFTTGGRGIVVGPVLGDDGFSDIYFVNEGNWRLQNRGDNAFFKNDGSGRFTNIAAQLDLDDLEPGRGVTLADFNNDELIDIAYGNWNGHHRMFLQRKNRAGESYFYNVATPEYATASYIRTVIAADFDNDGITEVLFNNIVYRGDASNKLFKVIPNGRGVSMTSVDIGDAQEQDKYGTGAAVADIDDDGVLELLISHGESASQPLTLYHVKRTGSANNSFIRIMPTTQSGAPARGSKVTLTLQDGTKLSRIIDGGSGYLCQMEPVAHFGLGHLFPREARIQWPDGHHHSISLNSRALNKMHIISFNGDIKSHKPKSEIIYRYHPESTDEEIKNAEDSSSKVSQTNRRRRPLSQRERRRHRNNRDRTNQYRLRSPRRHTSNIKKTTSVESSRLRSGNNTTTQRRHFNRSNTQDGSSRSETAHMHSYGKSLNGSETNELKSHHSTRANAHSRQQHPNSAESQRPRYISPRRENPHSKRRYSSKTLPSSRRSMNSRPEDSGSHHRHSARINDHSLLSRHSTAEDTRSQSRHSSGGESRYLQTKDSSPEHTRSQPRRSTNANRHYNPVTRHSSAEDTRSQRRNRHNSRTRSSSADDTRFQPRGSTNARHSSAEGTRSQRRHSANINHHNSRTRHSSADDTRAQPRGSINARHLNAKDARSQRRYSTDKDHNSRTRHSSTDDTGFQPRRSQRRHSADITYHNSRTRHSSADDTHAQPRRSTNANQHYKPVTRHLSAEDTHSQSRHSTDVNHNNSRARHSSADDIRSHQRHSTHVAGYSPVTKQRYNPLARHSTRENNHSRPKQPSRVEPYYSESRHSTEKSNTRRKQSSRTESSFPQTSFSTRGRTRGRSPSRTNYLNPNSRYLTQENIGSNRRQSTKVETTKSSSSRRRYPSPQHNYLVRSEPHNLQPRRSRVEIPDPLTRTTFIDPRPYHTTQHTPFAETQRSQSRHIPTPSRLGHPSRKRHERKDPTQPRRHYLHTRHSSNTYSQYGPRHNVTLGDHSSTDQRGNKLEPYSSNRTATWVAHAPNRRKLSMAGLQPKATQRPSLHQTHGSRVHAQGSLSNRRTRTRLEPLRSLTHRQTSTSSRRRRVRNKTRMSSYKMPKDSRRNSNFGLSAFHHTYPTSNSQQILQGKLSSELDHSRMSSRTNLNINARSQSKARVSASKTTHASQFHQGRAWTRSRGGEDQNILYRLRYKNS